jgi:hypothetical protein
MISRWKVAVVVVSLLATAGLANAKPSQPKKAGGTPIDGKWTAKGTVTVARHISDASVGQKFTRTWTIASVCGQACKTTLDYRTSSGHENKVPLTGKGKSWKGTLDQQVFSCTNGGTATGSLTFKLHVTSFGKKKKQRIATAMTGTGTQEGTGCATVKEVVKFNVTRG